MNIRRAIDEPVVNRGADQASAFILRHFTNLFDAGASSLLLYPAHSSAHCNSFLAVGIIV